MGEKLGIFGGRSEVSWNLVGGNIRGLVGEVTRVGRRGKVSKRCSDISEGWRKRDGDCCER